MEMYVIPVSCLTFTHYQRFYFFHIFDIAYIVYSIPWGRATKKLKKIHKCVSFVFVLVGDWVASKGFG